MPLVQAKCTNCGANLPVDSGKDAAVCSFCGAAFIIEKAINNYNIENAQIKADVVNVRVDVNEKSLIDSAKLIIIDNPYEAIRKYKQVLEINYKNWEAWYGIVKAHIDIAKREGNPFTDGTILAEFGIYKVVQYYSRGSYGSGEWYIIVSGRIPFENENELKTALNNALLYTPAEERKNIENFYKENVTDAKIKADEFCEEKNIKEKRKNPNTDRGMGCIIWGVVYVIIGVLIIIGCVSCVREFLHI